MNRARRRAPRTLTPEEQIRVLAVTGEHPEGFRDHVILSIALGTALREHEIVALNMGDVFMANGSVRRRIRLRKFKGSEREGAPEFQEVFVSERLSEKLARFLSLKRRKGESTKSGAPVFLSSRGKRIATRTLRHNWRVWQTRAEFPAPLFTFHELRHTACSNLRRATGDIRLVQRFARHSDLNSTMIYTQPGDEEVANAVDALTC